ncbi:MAG: FMN-binding negative transcriptional regulator [Planctomycetaceae bacterium]
MTTHLTYARDDFRPNDESQIFDCIEQYSFATLISDREGGPQISHLPMLLDREARKLIGHMARANPQWEHAQQGKVLCVFNGPHAYISPTWYEEQDVVPTWNYVAVHVRGPLNITHDDQATLDILRRYVAFYETGLSSPWSVDEADASFIRKLSQQTVAFEISIEHLEGIWKLSQHHSDARRQKVVAALESQQSENAQAIAKLMR